MGYSVAREHAPLNMGIERKKGGTGELGLMSSVLGTKIQKQTAPVMGELSTKKRAWAAGAPGTLLMEPISSSTSEKSIVCSSKSGCVEISTSVLVFRNFPSLLVQNCVSGVGIGPSCENTPSHSGAPGSVPMAGF